MKVGFSLRPLPVLPSAVGFFTQYRDSVISNVQGYHCLHPVDQLAAFATVTSSDWQHAARFPPRCVHAQKACWSLVAAIAATGNTYLRIQVAYFWSRLIRIHDIDRKHAGPTIDRQRATVFVEGTVQWQRAHGCGLHRQWLATAHTRYNKNTMLANIHSEQYAQCVWRQLISHCITQLRQTDRHTHTHRPTLAAGVLHTHIIKEQTVNDLNCLSNTELRHAHPSP